MSNDKNKNTTPTTDPNATPAATEAPVATPGTEVVERFQGTSEGQRRLFDLGPLTVPCDDVESWITKGFVRR